LPAVGQKDLLSLKKITMFNDRKDAGKEMGKVLAKYKDQDVLVLGLPRGGVEPAYYVARALNADLDVIIVRKLGYPGNPEAAFGAIAEDGSTYLSAEGKRIISERQREQVISREREEIKRRVETLRKGRSLGSLKGRTVILVDDGIATGATMFAAIEMCKKQQAEKIVVAAPVSSPGMAERLEQEVDEAVILETPEGYWAVSQGYVNFYNVSTEEAKRYLEKRKAEMAQ
jgi:putative phosphoribosyl transferase